MNSESPYVVIAIYDGGRVWSDRFNTRHAADHASLFLRQNDINVWVIEDCISQSAPPADVFEETAGNDMEDAPVD